MNEADWTLVATCPSCGGALALVADGVPQSAGTELHVIVRCAECRRGWVVQVRMATADLTSNGNGTAAKPVHPERCCEVCGTRVVPNRNRRTPKTCSPSCLNELRSRQAYARNGVMSGKEEPPPPQIGEGSMHIGGLGTHEQASL